MWLLLKYKYLSDKKTISSQSHRRKYQLHFSYQKKINANSNKLGSSVKICLNIAFERKPNFSTILGKKNLRGQLRDKHLKKHYFLKINYIPLNFKMRL